jgi:hypothetical protein
MEILSYKCVSRIRNGSHDVRVETNIVCSGLSRHFGRKVESEERFRLNKLFDSN